MNLKELLEICKDSNTLANNILCFENTGSCPDQEATIQHIKKYWYLFNKKPLLLARLQGWTHLTKCLIDSEGNLFPGTLEAGITLADVDGIHYKFKQVTPHRDPKKIVADAADTGPVLRKYFYFFENKKFDDIISIERYIKRTYKPDASCYSILKQVCRHPQPTYWRGIYINITRELKPSCVSKSLEVVR